MEDFYEMSQDHVIQFGGISLLAASSWSNRLLVKSIFRNYPWEDTKFSNTRKMKFLNRRSFLLELQKTFMIQRKEDWFRVSLLMIYHAHPMGVCTFTKQNSLREMLKCEHGDQRWPASLFSTRTKKSAQRVLLLALWSLFRNAYILEEYIHPIVCYGGSGLPMRFDVLIPSINFAFEYNGQQHYDDLPKSAFSPIEVYQHRDCKKLSGVSEIGITLIEVPYWWDNSPQSLQSMILSTLESSQIMRYKL